MCVIDCEAHTVLHTAACLLDVVRPAKRVHHVILVPMLHAVRRAGENLAERLTAAQDISKREFLHEIETRGRQIPHTGFRKGIDRTPCT